jgi:hypothetical protein
VLRGSPALARMWRYASGFGFKRGVRETSDNDCRDSRWPVDHELEAVVLAQANICDEQVGRTLTAQNINRFLELRITARAIGTREVWLAFPENEKLF